MVWEPPAEPLRPPLPYRIGRQFEVQRVTPVPPFADRYWDWLPANLKDFFRQHPYCSRESLKILTQTQHCQAAVPLPCQTLDETGYIEIVGDISTGYNQRAQLIICKCGALSSEQIVAKIFDPLYAPFKASGFRGIPQDPVFDADHGFACEAWAYEELSPHLSGGIIPEYYGSWKIRLPLGEHTRTVYLVLMEHVRGVSLGQFDAERCTPDVKLNVLAKVMEADMLMRFYGVNHFHLEPRNIICDRDEIGQPDLQIRIIDFNYAMIARFLGDELPYLAHSLPISPIQFFYYGGWPNGMEEWVVYLHPVDDEKRICWMRSRWDGSALYRPIEEELLKSLE